MRDSDAICVLGIQCRDNSIEFLGVELGGALTDGGEFPPVSSLVNPGQSSNEILAIPDAPPPVQRLSDASSVLVG
jgi:hypothetical protein